MDQKHALGKEARDAGLLTAVWMCVKHDVFVL
jgi:hypothetical protein